MSTPAAQPVGEALDFSPVQAPARREHHGHHVTLRPLDPPRDAEDLHALSHEPTGDPSVWTYLYEGPHASVAAHQQDLESKAAIKDRVYFTIHDAASDRRLGMLCYMEIVPDHGTIEIGNIWFAPELQRTAAATETIFLLARHAFDDLGYRRLEWKCNSLNAPSRAAAERFGFLYEGLFLQHRVVKGRNRDTSWYAITDRRWPAVRTAFETWLSPENFDSDGLQLRSLRELTAQIAAT